MYMLQIIRDLMSAQEVALGEGAVDTAPDRDKCPLYRVGQE